MPRIRTYTGAMSERSKEVAMLLLCVLACAVYLFLTLPPYL